MSTYTVFPLDPPTRFDITASSHYLSDESRTLSRASIRQGPKEGHRSSGHPKRLSSRQIRGTEQHKRNYALDDKDLRDAAHRVILDIRVMPRYHPSEPGESRLKSNRFCQIIRILEKHPALLKLTESLHRLQPLLLHSTNSRRRLAAEDSKGNAEISRQPHLSSLRIAACQDALLSGIQFMLTTRRTTM